MKLVTEQKQPIGWVLYDDPWKAVRTRKPRSRWQKLRTPNCLLVHSSCRRLCGLTHNFSWPPPNLTVGVLEISPKGIPSASPGLLYSATLGKTADEFPYPNGVAAGPNVESA
jgi:hypothetical protein